MRRQRRMSVKRPRSLWKKGGTAKSGGRRRSALAVFGKGRGRQGFSTDSLPVMGSEASAGWLEAYTKLLKHLPGDTGMAFVLVQHLDRTPASALTEILSRAAPLPVTEVKDGMHQLLEEILPGNSAINDFGVEHEFPRIGDKRMLPNARRVLRKDDEPKAIRLVIEDATQTGTTTA
jgi:two-component system CheB/CheR fusion protein